MKHRILAPSSVLAALLCLPLLCLSLLAAPPEWDRRTAEQNGWIYDDFKAGLAEAEATGKPLFVVLRCPP